VKGDRRKEITKKGGERGSLGFSGQQPGVNPIRTSRLALYKKRREAQEPHKKKSFFGERKSRYLGFSFEKRSVGSSFYAKKIPGQSVEGWKSRETITKERGEEKAYMRREVLRKTISTVEWAIFIFIPDGDKKIPSHWKGHYVGEKIALQTDDYQLFYNRLEKKVIGGGGSWTRDRVEKRETGRKRLANMGWKERGGGNLLEREKAYCIILSDRIINSGGKRRAVPETKDCKGKGELHHSLGWKACHSYA